MSEDQSSSSPDAPPPTAPPTATVPTVLPPPLPDKYQHRLRQIGKHKTYLDVRGPKGLWMAPFEMRQVLNPEELGAAVEARVARWVPLLEGYRNALVVVPLMLTWFSLGLAAAAYQQYIQKLSAKQTPLSFFQEWQLGFPELKNVQVLKWMIPLTYQGQHIFTFADVGFLDFAILFMLLVLTVLAQGIEAHAYRAGRDFARVFDQHLFELQTAFNASAKPGEPPWLTAVETAVRKLTNAVDGVAGIQEAAARLTGIYEQVRPIYERLEHTLPAMKDAVGQMVDTQQMSRDDWQDLVETLKASTRYIGGVLVQLDPSQAHRVRRELHDIDYPRPVASRPAWQERITSMPVRIGAAFRRTAGTGGRRDSDSGRW